MIALALVLVADRVVALVAMLVMRYMLALALVLALVRLQVMVLLLQRLLMATVVLAVHVVLGGCGVMTSANDAGGPRGVDGSSGVRRMGGPLTDLLE